jgi:tetratricopeptide (TPR) repeat protein
LAYENAGRLSQAIDEYESALQLQTDHAVAMRHLARAYVKTGRTDDRLTRLLERLLLSPGDPQWDRWARGQLVRIGRATDQGAADAP